MSTCPMGYGTSTNKHTLQISWKTTKKKESMRFFWVVSSVLLVLIAVFLHMLHINELFLLITVPLILLTAFISSLVVYEKSMQKYYVPLNSNKKEFMPRYTLINSIVDNTIRRKVSPIDLSLERKRRLGDIYFVCLGSHPAVVVNSSTLAQEVLRNLDVYEKTSPLELNLLFFNRWIGAKNVVVTNNEEWKRYRDIVNKALMSSPVYIPVMREKARLLRDNIAKTFASGEKKNIYLNRWLKAFSLDVAGECLFGYNFNYLNEKSNPATESIERIKNEVFNPLRVMLPIIDKLPLKSNKQIRESIKYIDDLVQKMCQQYIADDNDQSQNLLQKLIVNFKAEQLDAQELRDNIMVLLFASFETTQASLSGVLYYLAKYPEYQNLIREESIKLFPDIDQFMQLSESEIYERLSKFKLLDNFIIESLRLCSPTANLGPRTAIKDTELGGFRIKQSTLVIINVYPVHCSDSEWQDADSFNPDRFNEKDNSNKSAFLPFGHGKRICSGKNFSMLEQKIAICLWIRAFKFSLPTETYKVPLKHSVFIGSPEESFNIVFERL